VTESTDVQEPKTEAAEPEGEQLTEYTSQTGDASATAPARPAARKPVVTGNAMGTGRRKEAIARVRISAGTGKWLINDRSLDEYFPNKVHQQLISEPFVTLGADDAFDVVARITGGGVTGQAGALRLGIARALQIVDPENRPSLKRAGFLTRDARVKERKKAGLKKARKAPQYSKR
jgi:small subunit ribosomal protein S9